MSDYWVFGASRSLGAYLAEHLCQSHNVVSFSRSDVLSRNSRHRHVKVDFQNADQTRDVIKTEFAKARPASAVFCQRYRPAAGMSDLAAISAGLNVELGPLLALTEEAKHSPAQALSLVLLTSVASHSTHTDIDLYYHVLKSITVTAARFLAVHGGKNGVRANSVVLGEFEKYPRASYTPAEQAKFDVIEQFTPTQRICTMADIANVIEFLMSEKSSNLTGQSFSLDGHLSGVAQESILRRVTLSETST